MGRVGKVWLVGAGPGDPGLLTLKGRAVLGRADVVFFDRLVNPGILAWAKPGTEVIDVGKEPGGKRAEQPDICRGLIQAARKWKEVVRLKGGDPFVFGRGGEEAEVLAKAGIPFEVVPGVTSGVAAPAMEGIPVTHRGLSTELVFKIGSRAEGSVSGKTLVGYMSVEGLEEFLQRAVESGFSPETPAALISRGTCRGQRSVVSNLGNLSKDAKKAAIRAPAVVVIGGVVGLRKWTGRQVRGRLAGQRVVLTASKALGKGWREVFEKEGAEVWELPMTEIRNLKPKASWADQIAKAKWVVFTSGAGVRTLPGVLGDLRKLAGKKIAVVGRSTAAILQSIGLKADFVGPGPGAEALARVWPGKKAEPTLHITGTSEDGKFARHLQKKGFQTGRIKAYQNIQPTCSSQAILVALRNEGADWVVFASATAAKRFRKLFSKLPPGLKVAVIGETTARAVRQVGWFIHANALQPSPKKTVLAIQCWMDRRRVRLPRLR